MECPHVLHIHTATQGSSWQHPRLTTKIASVLSHLFIHAHSDRGKRNKKKKIPIKDLAGFDGERSYEKPRDDELLMSMNVLAT